jgi:hypothetical protein
MLSARRLQRLAALRSRRPRVAHPPPAPPPPQAARCRACAARAGLAAAAAAAPDATANPVEWPGLAAWRAAGVDGRRGWGARGADAAVPAPGDAAAAALPLAPSLVDAALQVLQTADPATKAGLAHRAWAAYCAGRLPLGTDGRGDPLPVPPRPARPERPRLVVPKEVRPRPVVAGGRHAWHAAASCGLEVQGAPLPPDARHPRRARPPGKVPSPRDSPLPLPAHMLHNLAHIELNAIDLAMDTVARCGGGGR